MKFLIEKKRAKGRKNLNGISIHQNGLAIKGSAFDRLIKEKDTTSVYGNIGLNEEGNLCLFLSFFTNPQLYKMHKPLKEAGNVMRISFGTAAKENLKPYIGSYEIKFIAKDEKNKITEVILSKI